MQGKSDADLTSLHLHKLQYSGIYKVCIYSLRCRVHTLTPHMSHVYTYTWLTHTHVLDLFATHFLPFCYTSGPAYMRSVSKVFALNAY